MHSWGLYNGRYGLSNLVLIDRIPSQDRPLAERMLDGEIDRQKRLKAEITKDPQTATWLEEKHLFQNYKQLQFFDTLALYFNRVHPSERTEQKFEHVPLNADSDVTIVVRPREPGVLRGVALSVRGEFRQIRFRRTFHRAAAKRRRMVVRAEGNTNGVGKLSSRSRGQIY